MLDCCRIEYPWVTTLCCDTVDPPMPLVVAFVVFLKAGDVLKDVILGLLNGVLVREFVLNVEVGEEVVEPVGYKKNVAIICAFFLKFFEFMKFKTS